MKKRIWVSISKGSRGLRLWNIWKVDCIRLWLLFIWFFSDFLLYCITADIAWPCRWWMHLSSPWRFLYLPAVGTLHIEKDFSYIHREIYLPTSFYNSSQLQTFFHLYQYARNTTHGKWRWLICTLPLSNIWYLLIFLTKPHILSNF